MAAEIRLPPTETGSLLFWEGLLGLSPQKCVRHWLLQHVPGLDLDLMSLPVSFDGRRPPVRRRAPTLGEHTKDIVDLPPAAG